MAREQNNTANASVGKGVKGGYIFKAPLGTPLPTAYYTEEADLDPAFQNLGYISEDGINNEIEVDSENFKDMNGDVIENASSEYTETLVFTLVEQKKPALEMEYGSGNVTDSEGQITARHRSDPKDFCSLVALLILKNGRRQTLVVPNGQVTEVGEKQYASSELIGRELTVTCYPDVHGDCVIDYIESTDTKSTEPLVSQMGFILSASEANKKISAITGKEVSDADPETWFVGFDKPVKRNTPYLFTVEVNDKEYGMVTTVGGDNFTCGYWSMKSGEEVDFVDKVAKSDNENAKCDLSSYHGEAVLSVYQTDKQTPKTYPTGLVLVRRNYLTL